MKPFLRRALVLLVLYASTTAGNPHAQDGEIIIISKYDIHDTDAVILKKRHPFFDSLTTYISLQQITYLSDGLKIKGFVAQPVKTAKYPAVMYCRGGNREFGSFNAFEFFYKQQMAAWGYVIIALQNRGCCGKSMEGKGLSTLIICNLYQ